MIPMLVERYVVRGQLSDDVREVEFRDAPWMDAREADLRLAEFRRDEAERLRLGAIRRDA